MFRFILRQIAAAWRHIAATRDPVGFARSLGVRVGENCRILANPDGCFGSEPYLVTLGDHVTVTNHVSFVTHDGGVWVFREEEPDIEVFGPIKVGNNVFIGFGVTIMPGVTIGDNCIIGAGAVVTRNVPSGQVAVGVPARCIKTVEEYWKSIQGKATRIRSLPPDKKREYLEDRFREVRA